MSRMNIRQDKIVLIIYMTRDIKTRITINTIYSRLFDLYITYVLELLRYF